MLRPLMTSSIQNIGLIDQRLYQTTFDQINHPNLKKSRKHKIQIKTKDVSTQIKII